MKKFLALLTLPLLLANCAALDMKRGVNDENKAKIHKVAVISLLGDKFHNIHIGTTAFTNEESVHQVNWGIDDYATAIAVDKLKATGRYEVVALKPTPQLQSAIEQNNDHPISIIDLFTDHADTSGLQTQLAQSGADTAIIINPVYYDNAPFLRPGYGLFEKNTIGLTAECEYAQFVVMAYDVANKKNFGWQWGFNTWSDGPCKMDEKVSFKENFAYTPEEQQYMQQVIKQKISDGLTYALKELEVTQ